MNTIATLREEIAIPGCDGACLYPLTNGTYQVWDQGAMIGIVSEEGYHAWRAVPALSFQTVERTYLSRFDAAQGLILDGSTPESMASRQAAARNR